MITKHWSKWHETQCCYTVHYSESPFSQLRDIKGQYSPEKDISESSLQCEENYRARCKWQQAWETIFCVGNLRLAIALFRNFSTHYFKFYLTWWFLVLFGQWYQFGFIAFLIRMLQISFITTGSPVVALKRGEGVNNYVNMDSNSPILHLAAYAVMVTEAAIFHLFCEVPNAMWNQFGHNLSIRLRIKLFI